MDPMTIAVLACSVIAFFTGVSIVVANVASSALDRAKVNRSLQTIDKVYGANSTGRDPRDAGIFGNRVSQLGRAATPRTMLARLRHRLDLAGNPPYWTVDRIFEIKGLGLIVLGLLGVVVGTLLGSAGGAILGGLVLAAAGFFLPDLVIYELAERRQQEIRRTLPDILDTLIVSVEAGLGFDAALVQITRHGKGPLAGEFARVLQEMQLGRSRVEALRALGQRTSVVELRTFCSIVVQATELGVPMADVLREQASQMRVRRRQRAEEIAQKIPVKILFPLIFCLLPPLFVIVLGPGVLNIIDVLGRR